MPFDSIAVFKGENTSFCPFKIVCGVCEIWYLLSYVADFCSNVTARVPQANHQDSLSLPHPWLLIVPAVEAFAFKTV